MEKLSRGYDKLSEVLLPAAIFLGFITIMIWIIGYTFDIRPEFMGSFYDWLNKPVSEAKVGNLLLGVFIIGLLTRGGKADENKWSNRAT